jgi:peroxiredoxin
MALRQSRMLALGTRAPDFSLPDTQGAPRSLAEFAPAPALLVAFVCNHCPYVKHMLAGFIAFAHDYAPKGVATVAINSNDATAYPEDGPPNMAKLASQLKFPFPYLYDESQSVALAYGAVCTPDLFLFDRERRLSYRGQFDGSRPGNRIAVTGGDLKRAADATLAGQALGEQIASAGCSIKWKPGREPEWA